MRCIFLAAKTCSKNTLRDICEKTIDYETTILISRDLIPCNIYKERFTDALLVNTEFKWVSGDNLASVCVPR